jgi:hypothetical protein
MIPACLLATTSGVGGLIALLLVRLAWRVVKLFVLTLGDTPQEALVVE